MRKKYLILLLIPLLIAFAGCGKKKKVAPPPELNPPTNLTVTVVSYKQVNLSWQDNSTIEDGFRVCCDMGGNQYQTVDTLPANTTSFQHYNMQPMKEYTYYVQAYRGDEYGNSKEVSAKVPCPVVILTSELQGPEFSERESSWLMIIRGEVRNNATERCRAELTAYSPGYPTLSGGKTNPYIEAGETWNFYIRYTIGGKTKSYTVEIADVFIYY